jgi:hypothetical protein
MKRETKKEKIVKVEAKLAAMWAEYHASSDDDLKFSLLRLETGLHRQLQALMAR